MLSVHPSWALEGARVTLSTSRPAADVAQASVVRIGGVEARVTMRSAARLTVVVPHGLPSSVLPVTVEGIEGRADLHVGSPIATGIHQVDSPAIDTTGCVYLTNSGPRGQRVEVSVSRVPPGGVKEDFLTDLVNATSLAFDPYGDLHVSSRQDGAVYRVKADRTRETVASDLGVACGIAFAPDGTLFVGDRDGTIFRVGPARHVTPFATLPASIAAFHLAMGPEDCLYATAPTFGTYDHVYRISRDGEVTIVSSAFGRPQGLAVDERGDVYVVDAVAGASGLYRLREGQPRELVLSAAALIGVALDPRGGLVVSSSDTAYRLDVPVKPYSAFQT
jgi:sugar lactone lactonase YvrE